MIDLALLITTAASELDSLAKQTLHLGTGLQNAAPGNTNTPNQSIQYLFEISQVLSEKSTQCSELNKSTQDNNTQQINVSKKI